MPQSLEENDASSNGQNMVSNLPLLFAGGYPTSLEKITERQLEKFVPFMVQCSSGFLQVHNNLDCPKPEWWPNDVAYPKPFRKPQGFQGDWHKTLRELVVRCYEHHKSIFLLRFCTQLSAYEQATLRFINNYNSTTSLYHRTSNKLLVTFRNENMLYDQQPTTQRKSLLPKSPSNHAVEAQQQMVETSLFDIYLCDNCDAELYSLAAYTEHEKSCFAGSSNSVDDDDVILIDSEDLVPEVDSQAEFLSMFHLHKPSDPPAPTGRRKVGSFSYSDLFSHEKQLRRLPNRAAALTKCPTIPISSPCGLLMFRQTKNLVSREYQGERLDRLERFCGAPVIQSQYDLSRFVQQKTRPFTANVTFRKPDTSEIEYYYHTYKFPRRQLSTKQRRSHFNQLNSLYMQACRPLSVKLKRLSNTDIEIQKTKLRQAAQKVSFAVPPQRPHIVEFIDLCSSDEEEEYAGSYPETEDVTNLSGGSGTSSNEVDENQIQKFDGTLISMPVSNPIFPVSQHQLLTNANVQPLRSSVFLFSNNFNNNSEQIMTASEAASKTNSINQWLNSATPTARKSTAPTVRKMPGLVHIQQLSSTTIRTGLKAADIAS